MLTAIIGAALQLTSLVQSDRQFARRVTHAEKLQSKTLEQASHLFVEQQTLDVTLHHKRVAQKKVLFYAEMEHAQEIGRREAVRDVWSQRNQLVQTLMVLDTLIFACTFQLIVEGLLTPGMEEPWPSLLAGFCAMSMGLLFASIWLAVKLQARLATYSFHNPAAVYTCSKAHPTFTDYYDCHCRRMQSIAVMLFVAGLIFGVAALGIYIFASLFISSPTQTNPLVAPAGIVALSALLAVISPCVLRRLVREPAQVGNLSLWMGSTAR